ncbi:hypothetical protein VNO80_14398 [Phaseolus coccineus]|uniref:Uncharacterized protein n=1 Tax=Phaseolus coccineus TaxID=3886 RepID=A0AAN9MJP1_PHACN
MLVGERWHSILKETLTSQLCRNNQVSCVVLIVAASMSAALAATEVPAPAPGPSSGASATVVGSLVGASVMSFFALFH